MPSTTGQCIENVVEENVFRQQSPWMNDHAWVLLLWRCQRKLISAMVSLPQPRGDERVSSQ